MTAAVPRRLPWIWIRIDELLAELNWSRADLNDCARDCYNREFADLNFEEGRVILRSLGSLIGFKKWLEKRSV